MSIKPLPPDVVSQIQSSIQITSINNVVCELVKNSMDAEASHVSVHVKYGQGGCLVEDDGKGVEPSEFGARGGLGKSYRKHEYDNLSFNIDTSRYKQVVKRRCPWISRLLPLLPLCIGPCDYNIETS